MISIVEWQKLAENEKVEILKRPQFACANHLSEKVSEIIAAVKKEGDNALYRFTQAYDKVELTDLAVSEEEFSLAQQIPAVEKSAILFAKEKLLSYHQTQLSPLRKVETHPGVFCSRLMRPIESVGLYVPGGSAPLVSTVLMLSVPTLIAKNKIKILCTPPNEAGEVDPRILYAAKLCGITHIYKVGGAQAIAGMAYGTASLPKVDKIFGPGNQWVTLAKMQVAQGETGTTIDMPAGPSEVLIIADDEAHAEFVAADLLAQAEHNADSQVILITFSNAFAETVIAALNKQLLSLVRADIIQKALSHSTIIIAADLDEAFSISNTYAPEHLILQITEAEQYVPQVEHAGAIFVGAFTPETLGDYLTGSNHVLPTGGYAKSVSGLSVADYMKYISVQIATQAGLQAVGPYAQTLAEIEGLTAHSHAVRVRLSGEINAH